MSKLRISYFDLLVFKLKSFSIRAVMLNDMMRFINKSRNKGGSVDPVNTSAFSARGGRVMATANAAAATPSHLHARKTREKAEGKRERKRPQNRERA